MSDASRCERDDWVEVEAVVLQPAERASGLPAETADKPLLMWVKGFALAPAVLGEETQVETATGRRVAGRLSAVNPGYTHTFGQPSPELVHVGRDLRSRLRAYRASGEYGDSAKTSGGES
jgi:hypothetical protein